MPWTTPAAMLAALALAVALTACGEESEPAADSAGTTTTASASAADAALGKACPKRMVIQTDWFPEPEHGPLYQLAGPDGDVDAERGAYSSEIGASGVVLEIRAGGPFIGDQQVSSLLYQEEDLYGGFVNTDEAIALSGKLPTIGVATVLDKSPSMLMWNPEKWDFETLADIGRSDAKVLHFEGTTFIDYLVGKGYLREEQLDASYDGSPSRFVASGGAVVQQGFATTEPYKYENDLPAWRKPVAFQLVSEAGYQPYPENIAVRSSTLQEKAPCLKQLVPRLQQAIVDYARDPRPVNQALLDYVEELDTAWTLTPNGVADSVEKMKELEILAPTPLGLVGGYDMDRVEEMIEIMRPIHRKQGVETVKEDIKPSDIATNAFIDPKIEMRPARE